jgi:hypothetical protein
MADEKKKKKNTILGMNTRELQFLLANMVKRVPFMRTVIEALEGSRRKIEGEDIYPEEQ